MSAVRLRAASAVVDGMEFVSRTLVLGANAKGPEFHGDEVAAPGVGLAAGFSTRGLEIVECESLELAMICRSISVISSG